MWLTSSLDSTMSGWPKMCNSISCPVARYFSVLPLLKEFGPMQQIGRVAISPTKNKYCQTISLQCLN